MPKPPVVPSAGDAHHDTCHSGAREVIPAALTLRERTVVALLMSANVQLWPCPRGGLPSR
ncbi:MAG: hypothetical protein JWQ75_2513 [Pseudarthrobacter sp.]|nr:hypothetical protein [Pseudarthrobacter sp.]